MIDDIPGVIYHCVPTVNISLENCLFFENFQIRRDAPNKFSTRRDSLFDGVIHGLPALIKTNDVLRKHLNASFLSFLILLTTYFPHDDVPSVKCVNG